MAIFYSGNLFKIFNDDVENLGTTLILNKE